MDELTPLVSRAQAGDIEAYGAIVRRFQDMAYGFAYSFLGDFHLARDAAQEAFVEAFHAMPRLREPAAFPGWFRRIVHKHCDRLTRGKRLPAVGLEAATEVVSDDPTPPEIVERRELRRTVLAAIRALPAGQRTATTLFYINGYSQREVAAFLEVSVATVKKRLAASRGRLRERMIHMVDETLKSFALPERFADVVVQMAFVTQRINPLAHRMRALSNEEMLGKSEELRRRLGAGEDRDTIRAEAFALVRESSRRVLGQPHYDVQLVAALILDEGWIAEEADGEGKTITCFPAAYMAVLEGRHVHIVTVNDYLAARDAEQARAVLGPLGVTVGRIAPAMSTGGERESALRQAFQCDLTYGTVAEFGFAHLRDTLRPSDHEPIHGPMDFAIIDEADNVLIDEARTPLIISRHEPVDTERYRKADAAARELIGRNVSDLYAIDPENRMVVHLTAAGRAAAEQIAARIEFDEPLHTNRPSQIEQALRARLFYRRDRDYLVHEGKVVIIDEATGRPVPGRTWSEGLHQAIEVKEGLEPTDEFRTIAKITIEDYFRQYSKLAGVSGTAKAQARIFREGYGLNVAAVPTRRPVNRVDHVDRVYADADAKHEAIVGEVRHYSVDLARPVLVGTLNIEASEKISALLTERHGIAHEVLDARPERAGREADIIASAGLQRPVKEGSEAKVGAVTIATALAGRVTDIRTALAGRGTDIRLGEGVVFHNCRPPSRETLDELDVESQDLFPPGTTKCCIHCPEYDEATNCAHCFKPKLDRDFPGRGRTACRREPPCGLHVVGAGRYETRRADNQLRARAGRQGEPGSGRFFLSLDDDLMKRAAEELTERELSAIKDRGFVESSPVATAIERAQKKVEQYNFEIIMQLRNHQPDR